MPAEIRNLERHSAISLLRLDGKEASFSLLDQGIGITAQDYYRIFDRHFPSKNTLRSPDGGKVDPEGARWRYYDEQR